MNSDLYSTQLHLEETARQMGEARFREATRSAIEGGRESGTVYGASLLRRVVGPMIEAINEFLADAKTGRAGRRHGAVTPLSQIEPKIAAFIAAQAVIDVLHDAECPLATIASEVGTRIEDELRFQDFKAAQPGLWRSLTTALKGKGERTKRYALLRAYDEHVGMWQPWKKSDRLHLGIKLIELMVARCGVVEIRTIARHGKTTHVVAPTEELCDWIEAITENTADMSPVYLPMVVPPQRWDSSTGGGYLSTTARPLRLVKTRNRAYLHELDAMPEQMQAVYESINAIQETAWAVNTDVLGVITSLMEAGSTAAGLAPKTDTPIVESPFKGRERDSLSDEENEKLREWKKNAAAIHGANARNRSHRIRDARVVSVAVQFAQYERIYFPHQMDFRGRVYPVPLFLNPQGADMAKSLLRFAEAKPIGDQTGPGWLAIHTANTFGVDKVSFEDRVAWVEDNSDRIAATAADPYDDLWWTEADSPFCFLAACFEWAGFLRDGADHLTRLPIALDGSCSGIQHFSAALRDEVGGAAVNLVPAEKPADVYAQVAERVIAKLRQIVTASGTNVDDAMMASRILDFGLDRAATKTATMTLPYGSTRFSCRDFVMEWIEKKTAKMQEQGLISPLQDREWEAAGFLAGFVWDAIGETVIAARSAMDYLRSVARELSKEQVPIMWTTPDGLPVVQEYPSTAARRVKTMFGAQLVYLNLREEQDGLDARRQANGVAPNWVHSYDATHLRMVAREAATAGVTSLAVIHDSFGCHAGDTDALSYILRQTMVDLYKGNVLGQFRLETCSILPASGNIPHPPEMGGLDLSGILRSDYVFA